MKSFTITTSRTK